ncbi:hypothetical protein JW887_05155 [Candidatus Dojkabacteria bacterium]|nr:hypothetical protein [Candidatus Dojkabacteria bacterium]
MALQTSLNLLPKISEEEVTKIRKKEKISVSGVLFLVIVTFVTLAILIANLLVNSQLSSKKQELSQTESDIVSLRHIELKQNTLNRKITTFTSAEAKDYRADKVLMYLMDVSSRISTVDSIYMNDSLRFEISGSCSSYINVARLWHNLAQEEDYFKVINLDYAQLQSVNGEERVSYSIKGTFIKDNLDNL